MLILAVLAWLGACTATRQLPTLENIVRFRAIPLPATPQTEGGDPQKGFEYITQGGYIGSGIPWDFFDSDERTRDSTFPRPGLNGLMPPSYNVFEANNGVTVASSNCFTCHATTLLGEYQLGMGDPFDRYGESKVTQVKVLDALMKSRYKKGTPEREAYQDYSNFFTKIPPYIIPPFNGPNPAFRLEEACVRYRDPATLEYRDEPGWDMIKYTLASDVPPLWHAKKKTALYWNGMGRGDFSKLLMQASVLGLHDSTQARQVQQHFVDVAAWLKTLEPPKYPGAVDQDLALQGLAVFEENCSRCHGTYGDDWTYPTKLVSLPTVGTDPYMALYLSRQSQLHTWYNESWYATTPPYSELIPEEGYVAPPLDGVWATAPYLHNGSVPTVAAVLDSEIRPNTWKRFEGTYDLENMGLVYQEAKPRGAEVYDTSQPGYGNMGHYFGDKLSIEERRAVIEYLKTL